MGAISQATSTVVRLASSLTFFGLRVLGAVPAAKILMRSIPEMSESKLERNLWTHPLIFTIFVSWVHDPFIII